MHSHTRIAAVMLSLVCAPAAGQGGIDWLAKESSMFQAVRDRNIAAFAAGLDSTFVGVYPIGVITRDAQVAAEQQDSLATFEISQFTSHTIDADDILLTYKVSITGNRPGTFWISSVWHRRGHAWTTILHTASIAT